MLLVTLSHPESRCHAWPGSSARELLVIRCPGLGLLNCGSGCGTAEEITPQDQVVGGLDSYWVLGLFSLSMFSVVRP